MRTTIDINDALLRQLRREAERSGRPFKAVVNETLDRGLAAARALSPPRPKLRPRPMALRPEHRNTSLNQLYDQLEAGEKARTL